APKAEEHHYIAEIGTVNKIPVDQARTLEPGRWKPVVQFRVHQEEGQDYGPQPAAFQDIATADDVLSAWMRAHVVIRHHPSLRVAASAWLRFGYAEEGGIFIPTIALESS